jgi:hypothetical protein
MDTETTTMTIDVKHCSRCGGDHAQLVFKKLTRPAATFQFWAMCPYLGEPILMFWTNDCQK